MREQVIQVVEQYIDAVRHDDLINWERLDVKGLDIQHGPDRLEIAEIAARNVILRQRLQTAGALQIVQGP